MAKRIATFLIVLLGFAVAPCVQAEDHAMLHGDHILPLVLDGNLLNEVDWEPGDGLWVTVEYCLQPDAEPLFVEPAERVWWIQDTAVLVLGASGYPFPAELTRRSTAYVRIVWDGLELNKQAKLVYPRRNCLLVTPDAQALQTGLRKRLTGVDGTYLAQVANFLANHLTTLDVQGTSFSVSEYGTVINSNGEWTGEGEVWTRDSDFPPYINRAPAGGIARSNATLYGSNADSHTNLGSNSTTGQYGESITGCTVGGGVRNDSQGYCSTVGGGYENVAFGNHATVAGGEDNSADEFCATVGGGTNNVATGQYATIAGGGFNSAQGQYSTVNGGSDNIVSGDYSTAAGRANRVDTDHSWVGGRRMHLASGSNTFVWGDGGTSTTTFNSLGNAFLVFPSGNTGRLGIGTPNPKTALHVRSGSDATLTSGGHLVTGNFFSYNLCIDDNEIMARNYSLPSDLFLNIDGGNVLLCSDSNDRVGIGTRNPAATLHVDGDIHYSGTLSQTSDRRYKKNIRPLDGALDRVTRIQGVAYDWNREDHPDIDFSDRQQIGFIAQDLKDALPQAVVQDEEGYYAVDYTKLTPLLVEAIKELKRAQTDLKKEIAALKRDRLEE